MNSWVEGHNKAMLGGRMGVEEKYLGGRD